MWKEKRIKVKVYCTNGNIDEHAIIVRPNEINGQKADQMAIKSYEEVKDTLKNFSKHKNMTFGGVHYNTDHIIKLMPEEETIE